MAKKHHAKAQSKSKARRSQRPANVSAPFIEHLHELRRRLLIVAVSIIAWSSLAYGVQHHIVEFLLAPADGAKFIYTTVGGGIDFLFRVSIYAGLLMTLPVIVYQSLRYIQPIIKNQSLRFILTVSSASGLLAIGGAAFGYYLGLPSALQFLLHQFGAENISALITVQSYLSFVLWYLLGSSLLFQVPLVLYIINRIKPLRLKPLFKFERWVILVSFIIAAMINPSPRIYDMSIIAIPMVLSYQIGIFIVWRVNRKRFKHRPKNIQSLLEQDQQQRNERLTRLQSAQYTPSPDIPLRTNLTLQMPDSPFAKNVAVPEPIPVNPEPQPSENIVQQAAHAVEQAVTKPVHVQVPATEHSRKYVNDFVRPQAVRRPISISTE